MSRKVSVITINYNDASGLRRTLESLVQQHYPNKELIVIDGGSTDGSLEVIGQYASQVSYWLSEKDKGVFDAQNKGLARATGDYVLVLNGGDELADAHVLERVFTQEQTADIVYGDMLIVQADGRRVQGAMPGKIDFNHMMRDTLWHPVSFVKRSFLPQVGPYDLQYNIVADYDWFLRAIFRHKATLQHLHTVVSVFYLGGLSSLPENDEKIRTERIRAQTALFGEEKVQAWYASQPKPSRSIVSRILKRLFRT